MQSALLVLFKLVLLILQPYAQRSVVSRPFPKLPFMYFGSFEILQAIGSVAYKLKLPDDSLIHPVFHVSQLKQFVPDNKPMCSQLPTAAQLDIADFIPSEVLDRRMVKKRNAAVVQNLACWGSLPAALATWEDADVVRTRFPDAVPWGQAPIPGGQLLCLCRMNYWQRPKEVCRTEDILRKDVFEWL
jgi:hypothetical protein